MESFKKWMNITPTFWEVGGRKRMVNQPEIVEYFRLNPGNTERQMQEDVYGYFRTRSILSNKKYAECLRRALQSGKLTREKVLTEEGYRFVYFKSDILDNLMED
jgi:hypothetical protein